MLTVSEIVRSVYGAWRLARFDAIGMEWLDRSAEGFRRSFLVAILLLPLEAVKTVIVAAQIEFLEPILYIAATTGIAYVIAWTAFPVLAHPLVTALGRAERYPGYITAINWSRIVLYAVIVPLILLSSLTGPGVGPVLQVAYFVAWGSYHWFITKTALDLSAGPAVGLTMMEMVLIITTDRVAQTMMTAAAPVTG